MLEVETVLLGFVIGEEDVLAAMISVAMLDDIVECEGPESACKGINTVIIVARITSILLLLELKPKSQIPRYLHRLLCLILLRRYLLFQTPFLEHFLARWHASRVLSLWCLSLPHLNPGEAFAGSWWRNSYWRCLRGLRPRVIEAIAESIEIAGISRLSLCTSTVSN